MSVARLIASLTCLALVVSASTFSASARAGEGTEAVVPRPRFGARGPAIVSIENVFGYSTQEFHATNASGTRSIDHVGFTPGGIVGLSLGIHGVTSHFTYGATFGYWGAHSTNDDGSAKTAKIFHLGPRLGYAFAVNDNVGFWLRGGPTLYVFDQYLVDGTITAFDVSLDAYFVYSPTPHFGVMIGPSFDFSVLGHVHENGPRGGSSDDIRFKTLSLDVGLLSDF